MIAKIEVDKKMLGEEHIKKFDSFLNYKKEYKDNKNYVYGIKDSKVDSFKKGHVALSLPVISF